MRAILPMLLLVACLAIAGSTRGAIQVSLSEGSDATARNGWQIVIVDLGAPAGAETTVSVRDVRGGMQVTRVAYPGNQKVSLPLPLVAPAELAGSPWEIQIDVRRGEVAQHAAASLNVPSRGEHIWRVAIADQSAAIARQVGWKTLTPLPVTFVSLPPQEIETGPALVFAGVDAVVVPPDSPALTKQRVLALINAGVCVVVPARSDRPPALLGLVWDRLDGQDGVVPGTGPDLSVWNRGTAAWVTPAFPLHPPAVIEPALAAIHRDALQPPRPIIAVALATGPLAIALVLIARGLFRRPAGVCAAVTVSLAALAAGVVLYARHVHSQDIQRAAWEELQASDRAPTGGIIAADAFQTTRSFLASNFSQQAAPDAWVLPVAPSPRAYFATRDLRLDLGDNTCVLSCPLPARSAVQSRQRRAAAMGLVPAMPTSPESMAAFAKSIDADPAQSWWIRGGHVDNSATFTTAGDRPTLLQWAAGQPPDFAAAVRHWYELRFDGTHRYLLTATPAGPRFVDFGAAP